MLEDIAWQRSASPAKERSGAAVAAWSVLTIGVYYAYWIHRLHVETPARVDGDPKTRWAVAIPILVALVSLVPVVASGVFGDGEVDMRLFLGGMAINFVAHLIYLAVTLKLTDRLAYIAEAAGLDSDGLDQGKRDVVIGVASIAIENIGLKSASLLALDLPPWVDRLDAILLGIGAVSLWRWSRESLTVANAYARKPRQVKSELGLQTVFGQSKKPGALGVAPSELNRSERKGLTLIRRAQWMIDEDDDSGLGWFLESNDDLIKHGVVVPGTIVQANSNLFKDGDSDHPGELVFSLAAGASTDDLLELSSQLYQLKGEESPDPGEAFFSAYLADEMERVQGIAIPASITSVPEAYASTALFYRDHLPQQRLASGIYPLLVSPKTLVAMVLPYDFWTEAGYEIYQATGGHALEH